jgi:hypothetical protein
MRSAPLPMAVWMANFHLHRHRRNTALLQLLAALLSLLLLAGAFGSGMEVDNDAAVRPTERRDDPPAP